MSENKRLGKGQSKNKNYSKRKGKYVKSRRPNGSEDHKYDGDEAKLSTQNRDNNPNWYFTDRTLAEQASQLSFQQLGGVQFKSQTGDKFYSTCSIKVRFLNPSPGVQIHTVAGTPEIQKSAINLAGFRLFSKLSAYTGRKAEYSPQDISFMILFMGELISLTEWCRRAFGVAFTYSQRNRTYPKGILTAMGINADDFFKNFADYRLQFNTLITRLNQIPIPRNVAYFDKCASLYEKIYLDSESPLATCIFDSPFTTWKLDETSYEGGTILKTCEWMWDPDGESGQKPATVHTMGYYFVILSYRIEELLNSSTFLTVYTDLLNLATKMKMDFWTFDYLGEGYMVVPEYNLNYLLQIHNTTLTGKPHDIPFDAPWGVTPRNDVYPDPVYNGVIYNPEFDLTGTASARMQTEWIVDSPIPDPGVEDRIEMLRFTSLGSDVTHQVDGVDSGNVDCVLPDHYATCTMYWNNSMNNGYVTYHYWFNEAGMTTLPELLRYSSKVDWDQIYLSYASGRDERYVYGDLNYYTLVNNAYLKPLNAIIGTALYDWRS